MAWTKDQDWLDRTLFMVCRCRCVLYPLHPAQYHWVTWTPLQHWWVA